MDLSLVLELVLQKVSGSGSYNTMVLYVGRRRLYRSRARLKLVVGTVAAIGFLLVSLTKSFVVGLFLVLSLEITTIPT